MLPSLTEQDLKQYFDRADLIRQTAEQLQKDLGQSGFDITYPEETAKVYEELFRQTEPYIQKLIDNNYEKLLQLLYRIDVSEKLVSKTIAESQNASSAITRLILFRELQKVVIRNHYSK